MPGPRPPTSGKPPASILALSASPCSCVSAPDATSASIWFSYACCNASVSAASFTPSWPAASAITALLRSVGDESCDAANAPPTATTATAATEARTTFHLMIRSLRSLTYPSNRARVGAACERAGSMLSVLGATSGTLLRRSPLAAVLVAAAATAASSPPPAPAAAACMPRASAGYSARVLRALRSGRDVWGEELLRARAGPSYAGARRYLAPLFLARARATTLTTTGAHYVPFAMPVPVQGTGAAVLHVADGSEIRADRAGGPRLVVRVG